LTARALSKPIKLVIISGVENLPKPLANIESIVFENGIESDIQKISNRLMEIKSFHEEYNYNILPSKIDIRFSPNPDFVGRDRELVDLYLEIIGDLNKLNYNTVGINGIGGVGKTQLAVEFFYRYAYAFDNGVFWIDGYDPTRWLEQIVSIARDRLELEISEAKEDITEREREKRYFIAFQKYCRDSGNGSKMLLVIDNVIDPLDLNKDNILFPQDSTKLTLINLGCNILFTSRREFEGKLPTAIQHRLENLLPKYAYELLTKYRKINSSNEVKYVKNICNSLGYLPLAIVLVANYLRKYSDMTVQEYYEEHIKDKLGSIDLGQISSDELVTRHVAAVRATFEPDWKILEIDSGQSLQETQKKSKLQKTCFNFKFTSRVGNNTEK
jgi:NB-ARC domain-containing protein